MCDSIFLIASSDSFLCWLETSLIRSEKEPDLVSSWIDWVFEMADWGFDGISSWIFMDGEVPKEMSLCGWFVIAFEFSIFSSIFFLIWKFGGWYYPPLIDLYSWSDIYLSLEYYPPLALITTYYGPSFYSLIFIFSSKELGFLTSFKLLLSFFFIIMASLVGANVLIDTPPFNFFNMS